MRLRDRYDRHYVLPDLGFTGLPGGYHETYAPFVSLVTDLARCPSLTRARHFPAELLYGITLSAGLVGACPCLELGLAAVADRHARLLLTNRLATLHRISGLAKVKPLDGKPRAFGPTGMVAAWSLKKGVSSRVSQLIDRVMVSFGSYTRYLAYYD